MINFIRIVTFVVAIVVTIFSIFYVDAEQELGLAKKAYKARDMDQTLRLARRANSAFSENNKKVEAYYLQAKAASKMNWIEKGKDYLDRLLMIDQDNVSALLFRGELGYRLGENQQALSDLDKGINLAIDNSSKKTLAYYYTQRGLTHLALIHLDKANKDALTALDLDSDLSDAHDLMSRVLEQKGDIAQALAECERAYQLSVEKDNLSFMSPRGQKLSDRLVNLKVKYLQSVKSQ